MTTIVCDMEDCIYYKTRGGKPGRCKCDVIGIKLISSLPETHYIDDDFPTCDSYMATPEILKGKK